MTTSNQQSWLLKYFLIIPIVTLVKIIVTIYTWFTLPIYFLIQNPQKRLKLAQNCGAQFLKKDRFSNKNLNEQPLLPETVRNEPYLEYERFVQIPEHPLMKCNTVVEAMLTLSELYPKNSPALGYREILDEEIQHDQYGNPIRIDGKVLRKYKLSDYHWITYGEFLVQMEQTSRGMQAIGLKKNDALAIYSETCLNFFISEIAATHSGALIVTVFHTLTDQGLIHALNETKCKFICVSFELLDRLAGFIQKCPTLKTVIYFEGPKRNKPPEFDPSIRVITLTELKQLGQQDCNKHLKANSLGPEDLFGVMYTSGTTGIPKGVKCTQLQVKEAAMAIGQVVRDVILDGPEHIYIAYLPQAHILESTLEFFLFLGGVKIGYATPFTLNETAPGLASGQICDLQLLKPTVMTAVPLVLDRMQKEIYAKLARRTPFSRQIFDYLMDYKASWLQQGYRTPIVNHLVCGKVQQQFGGRLQYMVVGGAPLASRLQKQIKCALNITLIQGYGSTETCGGVFCMDFNDLSFGRVGTPLNGVRVRLINWLDGGYSIDDKPLARGELIIGGKMISSGYLNRDDLTKESFFDTDGLHWFITGDIAQVYDDGTFSIVDRKKDIIKLSNGEFISLGKIEAILKSSIYVDNVCMVPNNQLNCLIALIVPNQLALNSLIKQQHSNQSSISLNDSIINQLIHKDLINVGLEQGLKSIELPSKILICNEQWTPDNNLLTAAMKLKRANILKFYQLDLDKIWQQLQMDPSKIRIKVIK